MNPIEAMVLQAGLAPKGVKVWSNRCWFGDEWEHHQIPNATADTKDALVARGYLRNMGKWGTKFETTEVGKVAYNAYCVERDRAYVERTR